MKLKPTFLLYKGFQPLVSRIDVPRRIGLDYISSEATNGSVGGEMLYERLEIWTRFLELGLVITVSLGF